MPNLYVTSITTIALAILILVQTFQVIRVRRDREIAFGDGGDKTLLKRMRGQANTIEQAPIFIILLGLCDYYSAHQGLLWFAALCFVSGRVLHMLYFADIVGNFKLRFYGMILSILGTVLAVLVLTWHLIVI